MNIHILVGFARILRKCSTSFVQSFFQVEKLFSLSFRLPNPKQLSYHQREGMYVVVVAYWLFTEDLPHTPRTALHWYLSR